MPRSFRPPATWIATATLLFILLLRGSTVQGQVPAWQWAMSAGATVTGTSIVVDTAGNTYATGTFRGTSAFGATTLTSTSNADLFVAKITPGGTYAWAVKGGALTATLPVKIAIDGTGSLVLAGTFSTPTIAFGATVLTNTAPNGPEAFVAKLSPTGAWRWAVNPTNIGASTSTAVAVDGANHILVTGNFASRVMFGATVLRSVGDRDVFVAKLTPAGVWQWAAQGGGDQFESSRTVATDRAGNVYVAGGFESAGPYFGTRRLINDGYSDAFVAKLSPAGEWQWAVNGSSEGDDNANVLAIDSSANVYVTGYFGRNRVFLGPIVFDDPRPCSLGYECFVAKLSPAGVWQWAVGASSRSSEQGTALALDRRGHAYALIEYYGDSIISGPNVFRGHGDFDVLVAKLTPDGAWEWTTGAGGTLTDRGWGLGLDGRGNVYAAGIMSSNGSRFGNLAVPGVGVYSTFFARLSPAPLGLVAGAAAAPLTLIPNPAHETVRLTGIPPSTPATLYDALGRVVRTVPLTQGTATLDLRGLAPGLYLVRAGQQVRRLVVE